MDLPESRLERLKFNIPFRISQACRFDRQSQTRPLRKQRIHDQTIIIAASNITETTYRYTEDEIKRNRLFYVK